MIKYFHQLIDFLVKFFFYRCGCGKQIDDHESDVIDGFKTRGCSDDVEEWTSASCTSEHDHTDAYGNVKFIGFGESVSKVNSLLICQ